MSNSLSPARILESCAALSPKTVPCTVALKHGAELGGSGGG